MKLQKLLETVEMLISERGGDADVAAWLMTSNRVREILHGIDLTDEEVRAILQDLQNNWGDPPIDDQLVEGVLHLAGLEGPENAP